MGALIIERARNNIRERRNWAEEETPQYQQFVDQAFKEMRVECEGLLDHHGQTSSYSRWLVFHPWILMAALLNRVKPVEILEQRKLSLTLQEAEPPVTITLSHAGRIASRSKVIEVAIQEIPDILNLYRDGGKVLGPDESGHTLRRANMNDARNYREVVGLFVAHFKD